MKLPIGLMAAAIAAGAMHEGAPSRACDHEEFCPEPELPLADVTEHGRPGPMGPAFTSTVTSGTTGPTYAAVTGIEVKIS